MRTVRPQTPPNHQRVLETSNDLCHPQRLHTPPRALLNMDITQRNMHELQTRTSMSPPPPAPVSNPGPLISGSGSQIREIPGFPGSQIRETSGPQILHPPIAALVSQRREALVRTNPRLRHNLPASVHQLYQNPRSASALNYPGQPRFQPRPGPSTSPYQYPSQMPHRYHSEESLASKGILITNIFSYYYQRNPKMFIVKYKSSKSIYNFNNQSRLFSKFKKLYILDLENHFNFNIF